MNKQYALSLHIFRRDLRLEDNTALIAALSQSQRVIPCFIFDKRQIEQNDYQSDHAIQFMVNTLYELNEALKQKNSHIYCFYGEAENVIKALIHEHPIEAIFINRDYTPFSRTRDQAIHHIAKQNKLDFHVFADCLLHEPEEILKANGEPYTVFTPFFKKASLHHVRIPQRSHYQNYYNQICHQEDLDILPRLKKKYQAHLLLNGGRKEGLHLLKNINNLHDYAKTRDFPALDSTSKLSAHHKFGSISIRESYHTIVKAFSNTHTLINELYWRDFFTHIAFHYPYVFGHAFHKKYDALPWDNNPVFFKAWCEGQTGFPIVDAGMRQLNQTGYMHNRVRMITASFLTKDLHIDWHLGERYFAKQLIDYDPAVNNGNWQWAASTGCDAQPYFRIFNPWLQQIKFDPDCVYIKRYIPELSSYSAEHIHDAVNHPITSTSQYPAPIVNHSEESKKSKQMYKLSAL